MPSRKGKVVAFKTITARFPGTCKRCGDPIEVGSKIRWAKRAGSYHLVADCPGEGGGSDFNYGGRCIDAPCCGHSRCGFGPGVPGYGSSVGGFAYYGEG